MKKSKFILFVLLALNLVGYFYIIFVLCFICLSYPIDIKSDSKEIYTVVENYKLDDVATDLYDMGLIKNKTCFKVKCKINGNYCDFKQGSHVLSQSMSVDDIISELNN